MKILGCGYYLPKKIVTSDEVDGLASTSKGTVYNKTGIVKRHYADFDNTETASKMGSIAAKKAIKNSKIDINDIDMIIGANATKEILLPCSASLVQRELGLDDSGIYCFDVGSSCLSFVSALEIADMYLKSGKYKNILIVSSEIASQGINYNQIESAGLFGDGAAAFVVGNGGKSPLSKFKTYSKGAHYTQIQGGGTRYLVKDYNDSNKERYMFDIDGKNVFKLVKQKIGNILDEFILENNIDFNEINVVIPHQASMSGIKLITKQLKIDERKMINMISEYGNMIAASIPFVFAYSIENNLIKRNDKVMLLGTAAGITIGLMVLEY